MGKYNDVVSIGQDFYNQNSYTLGVTYNGVDMIQPPHELSQHQSALMLKARDIQ